MLSEQDHQLISASLDGELAPEQEMAFKHRLLQEPALNKQYQAIKAMGQDLKNTFADIASTPVPQSLSSLLEDDIQVENEQKATQNNQWRFLALAASVAAIGLLSFFGLQNTSDNQVSIALTKALNTQPAMQVMQLDSNNQFIVLQSFRHNDGRVCREYQISDTNNQSHAIACKKNQQWQLEVTQSSVVAEQAHHVTASGEEVKTIEQYLKGAVKGEFLTSDDEMVQIKRNWQ